MPRFLPVTALLAAAVSFTGCATTSDTAAPADRPTVMAAFYPLQWATQQVGGDAVVVESLTPPGAEPHDVELSPQQVAAISQADLVVTLGGFQPAVDEAVAQLDPARVLDVAADLRLLPGAGGGTDPHVWLDPQNMITISREISERVAPLTGGGGAEVTTRAATLAGDLEQLDRQWQRDTTTCRNRTLVVSHEAFGYLAARYDFEQVGISGLSPEAEPSPARVAEVADLVREQDVQTIYFETLVDPKVASTVAAETGAATAVLDPLESEPADGQDYLGAMRTNLTTVVAGQPCDPAGQQTS